jgi:2'-5' RNA ligase
MIITNYNSFLEAKSGKLYRYGCVMVYLDIPNWESIVSHIDESDLYKPDNRRYAYESDPHVTILFGLHPEVSDDDVFNVFKNIKSSDISIDISGVDIFENSDFDVVKMNVKPGILNTLNKELLKLPHTTDYPDYKPHITMAYVLPGEGQKYIQPEYQYTFDQVKKIIYSKSNGEKLEITLE